LKHTLPLLGLALASLLNSPSAFSRPDQTKTGEASVKTEKILKNTVDAKPCVPQSAPGLSHGPRREFKFRKGEKYRNSPVVFYEVNPDGKPSNVKLMRSTGVKDIDDFAVDWVKKLKYKPAPGCVGFESQMTITIDFRDP
jgi:TonB family protein